MFGFITRRLFHGLLILLGVSFLTFFLINQAPGSYFDAMRLDPQIPPEWIAAEEIRLGLNRPLMVTWLLWLRGIVTHLDFGVSFEYRKPVFEVLATRAPATALLSFTSLLFAWVLSIPLGILAGYKQHSWFDRISSGLAFIGVAIPSVLLALVAVFVAARTGWFPTGGLRDQIRWDGMTLAQRAFDLAWHLVLPTLVLGIGMLAVYMRQMRGSLLDVLRADYVRTARAKGLGEPAVLFRHAVRNAINPLITMFGFSVSGLLSGAVLVENVMDYPGLGQTTVKALIDKDIYLVMASVLAATAMLIVGNLVADILLAWSDPRIKLESKAAE